MKYLVISLALVACTPSTTEKHAAAEAAYGAQLQQCVQNNATRAGADECAAKVRSAWAADSGVVEVRTKQDAGAP